MFDPTPARQTTAAPAEAIDFQKLRLDGVYQMNAAGELMLRIKAPAGVISAAQALQVCAIAERFAGGRLHLTTRGSIELHRLRYPQLGEVARQLASVGLTSRGACGGAVRGISCSTTFRPGFEKVQVLARRIQRHFAGNPHFEGLPKKFKIAVEADYRGARHLIQDMGLVLTGCAEGSNRYDVWMAGGLGREPRAGFLYRKGVPEGELLPLIEAVVRVYRRHAPPPKRLKYLAATLGEARLRQLIAAEGEGAPKCFPVLAIEGSLTAAPAAAEPVEVPVFAGELDSTRLRLLAGIAAEAGDGFLALTADQNVALLPADGAARGRLLAALKAVDLTPVADEVQVVFRACPGSHACKMGLCPTREVARKAIAVMGKAARGLSWAISGCPNSCAQPQLAEVGIVTRRRLKDPAGNPQARFDLLRRDSEGLGEAVATDLDLPGLLQAVAAIS